MLFVYIYFQTFWKQEDRWRWKILRYIESGHGGARAAEYVKQNLFSNLIRHPKFISDTKSAIGLSLYL